MSAKLPRARALAVSALLVLLLGAAWAWSAPAEDASSGSPAGNLPAAPSSQQAGAASNQGVQGDPHEPAMGPGQQPIHIGTSRVQLRSDSSVGLPSRLRGLLGYGLLLALAYLLSSKRRAIKWRPVFWGLGLQAAFALTVLNPIIGQFFFEVVDVGVRQLLGFAEAGISFVFQSTTAHQVTYVNGRGDLVTEIVVGQISPVLKSFAFWVLPTVIFFSSLITLLYHLGVMQWIVGGMSRAMVYMLRTSGAETLSCTANIILGQTEAPLLVRPFVDRMTRSELMTIMVGGFATVAGGVLAIYVAFLHDIPGIAGHLVTASIMAAPCSLAIAKILEPETGQPATQGGLKLEVARPDSNAIEAAARGATDGMGLVLNIAAMLVAFVALVAMINAVLALLGSGLEQLFQLDLPTLSLQQLLGWLLSPLAWAMGVPWQDAAKVGQLLGEKLILTELLAYLDLKSLLSAGAGALDERSAIISSYALCGFANVASIGIQIGGIGGMAPARRGELAQLGLRAMLGGALVSCLSGTIAGIIL